MRAADVTRLIVLAALWGASFLLTRILAPTLGPVVTAEARVAIAAAALLIWLGIHSTAVDWRAHARVLVVVGATNSALPFALLSFAAMTLPAGYSAILNATAPLFAALLGAVWLRDSLTPRKLAGLFAGVLGVALLVNARLADWNLAIVLAAGAALSAALCYAFASIYIKRQPVPVPAPVMAAGSQFAAAVWLMPLVPFVPWHTAPTIGQIALVLGLALFCTAFAYLLFFRLIRDIGATRALTVTFLVPLFAILWGFLFLGETLTPTMAAGCLLVVFATWLVVAARS